VALEVFGGYKYLCVANVTADKLDGIGDIIEGRHKLLYWVDCKLIS
jgi:hypothetical protein